MLYVDGKLISDMSTDDLVAARRRVRDAIKVIESYYTKTMDDGGELRELRRYLRRIQVECGKRFIQERLF
jgi:hypothetical protein